MTERANTPELRFPEFNTDWTTNQAKIYLLMFQIKA